MPPEQCPECGRFLSRAFITSLQVEPAPCPKCELLLSAEQFAAAATSVDEIPTGRDEEPAAAADLRSDQPMMAEDALDPPPPPPPAAVAGAAPAAAVGTLAGWDEGPSMTPAVTGPPPDAAIVAGAGVFGALLGVLLTERRGRGGLLGLLLGVVAAAVARRVWELEDQG